MGYELILDDSYHSDTITMFKDNISFNLIKKVIIKGNKIKYIAKNAFCHCSNLEEVEIGDNIIEIGRESFYNCQNLKKVRLSNSITNIDRMTFYNCVNLKEINFPNNLISIRQGAFMNCGKLKEIKLNKHLQVIEGDAFNGCKLLKEVNIPNSVRIICEFAFNRCKSLIRFNVGEKSKLHTFSCYVFGIGKGSINHNSPYLNLIYTFFVRLKNEDLIIPFLKGITKNKRNVLLYANLYNIDLNDILFLLEEDFKGFKEGINYGI